MNATKARDEFFADLERSLAWLAEELGYESIDWCEINDCYAGYGSTDPRDRSRDDESGQFVAGSDDDLFRVALDQQWRPE